MLARVPWLVLFIVPQSYQKEGAMRLNVGLCFALSLWCRTLCADIVYNSISDPQPYNEPSLGYQATGTAEFGDEVQLAGTARQVTTVTVGMSNWAMKSNYLDSSNNPLPAYTQIPMDANGFSHPLTLSLYAVDHSGPAPAVGALLTSKTVTASVPWKPENLGVGNQQWLAPDGNKYNGIFFTVPFDLSGSNITLPNQVIAAISFNTNTWGAAPIGAPGPYESLNLGLSQDPDQPTVGSNVNVDQVFWNTAVSGFYADSGAGGVGTLRLDTNWAPYTPTISISAVPEANAFLLGGSVCGLVLAAVVYRRRRPAKVATE